MSRYGRTLLRASTELLDMFNLTKGGNRTGAFPYGESEESIIKTFEEACNTRENYLKFIELYKQLISSYEVHIKSLKGLHSHFSFIHWCDHSSMIEEDLSDIQSTRAKMSNEVAKLIYLRRVGKKWRHRVNAEKFKLLTLTN